jgi:nitrite reductase/ring-hydroxylating ferredoxin subunit/hemerythrin-like domain-containing protein
MTSQRVDDFSPPGDGEMVTVDADGTAVAVTVVDGQIRAFEDTCPHAGCSLADGDLEGNVVLCLCHLARFDITTGAVLEGPIRSGIRIWAARVTDGTLELEEPGEEDPSQGDDADSPGADAMTTPQEDEDRQDEDITVLIEKEHEAFRRRFDALEGMSDPRELDETWNALVDLLEIHASAEESILYPSLVRADEDETEEAEHAVRDHNEIRDSVRRVEDQAAGSDDWWAAVRAAREVNESHLQEEERDVLPSFRQSVEQERREELARRWLEFHDEHRDARGLTGEDVDPETVVTPGPEE